MIGMKNSTISRQVRRRYLQDVQQTSGAEGDCAGRGHEPPLPECGRLLPGDNLVNYVNHLSTKLDSIGLSLLKVLPVQV